MGRPDDNSSSSDEDNTPVEIHDSVDLPYEPEINEIATNDYQQEQQQPQPQQQQYQQQSAPPPQYAQAPPPYAQAVPPQYPPPPPPKQTPQQYPPQQFPPQQPQQFPPQKPQANPNGYGQQTYPPAPQMQYQIHPGSPYKSVPQAQRVAGSPAPGYPMQARQQYQPNPPGTQGWSTGLFDCMDDPDNALTTFFVPWITFGQIAEIIDQGHTSCGTGSLMYGGLSLLAVPWLLSCTFRTKLRNRYDLIESPAPDWATHFLCGFCALCQEYRELRHRGYDPAIGWHGNQLKAQQQNQQQNPGMNPPGSQTMM